MKTVSFGTESLVFLGSDILDKIPNRFKSLDSLNEFLQNIKIWVLQQDFSFRLCKKLQSICYLQLAKKLKNIIICIYIYIYTYAFCCLSEKGAKNFSWPCLSPLRGRASLTITFLGKFEYIYLHIYIYIYIYIY